MPNTTITPKNAVPKHTLKQPIDSLALIALAVGQPHLGHIKAFSENICPQSGHLIFTADIVLELTILPTSFKAIQLFFLEKSFSKSQEAFLCIPRGKYKQNFEDLVYIIKIVSGQASGIDTLGKMFTQEPNLKCE
jgi:hypothetical protein